MDEDYVHVLQELYYALEHLVCNIKVRYTFRSRKGAESEVEP